MKVNHKGQSFEYNIATLQTCDGYQEIILRYSLIKEKFIQIAINEGFDMEYHESFISRIAEQRLALNQREEMLSTGFKIDPINNTDISITNEDKENLPGLIQKAKDNIESIAKEMESDDKFKRLAGVMRTVDANVITKLCKNKALIEPVLKLGLIGDISVIDWDKDFMFIWKCLNGLFFESVTLSEV